MKRGCQSSQRFLNSFSTSSLSPSPFPKKSAKRGQASVSAANTVQGCQLGQDLQPRPSQQIRRSDAPWKTWKNIFAWKAVLCCCCCCCCWWWWWRLVLHQTESCSLSIAQKVISLLKGKLWKTLEWFLRALSYTKQWLSWACGRKQLQDRRQRIASASSTDMDLSKRHPEGRKVWKTSITIGEWNGGT